VSTHAKEPESTPRQAARLGRTLRGAFARGTHSQRVAGSGPPSHRRGRLALLSLAAFAFIGLVLVVASAFASKEVIQYVGSTGSGSVGGEFSSPRDTAANSTGEGGVPAGTFYVADENNNRIQRFSPSGEFVSAWGTDVVQEGGSGDQGNSGAANFEICTVASECKAGIAAGNNGHAAINETQKVHFESYNAGNTYTLGNLPGSCSSSSTDPITYTGSAGTVRSNMQAALEAKCGAGNFSLASGPANPVVTFQGSFAGVDVPTMSCTTNTGSGTCEITDNIDGSPAQIATAPGNGALDHPQSLAVDGDTGNVYVSDRNNRRIDEYEGDGTFIRSFGRDVVESGPDQSDEVQTVTVRATAGQFTLSFEGETTSDIEWNASAAEVETALNALTSINTGGGSVSVTGGPGDETGSEPYVVTFDGGPLAGTEVEQLDAADGTTPLSGGSPSSEAAVATIKPGAIGFEVCNDAEGDICKVGTSGSGTGQISSSNTAGILGIAVSPPDGEAAIGTVFVADSGNRRVNTYALDGTSPADFGSSSQFGSTQPRKVAVDSRGIVYASNSNNHGEILRYDTENADGEGVGFLAAPIEGSIPGVNEKQSIIFSSGEGGIVKEGDVFTVTCPNGETTSEITYVEINVQREDRVREALESKCGGSYTMSTPYFGYATELVYEGSFEETNVPPITCTMITGEGNCEVVETLIEGKEEEKHALLATNSTESATAGLAVHPDSDGAGADTDVLFVLRDPAKGPTAVQQFGTAHEPGQVAAPTEDDDEHGAEAGFSSVNGLGFDDSSGRLFVSSTSYGFAQGIGNGSRVFLLDETPNPVPSLDPITTFDTEKATFTGTVNPEGGETVYRFEYVDNAEFLANGFENATQLPVTEGNVGHGTSPVAVEAETPHDLAGGTTYHVRLVAKRFFTTVEVEDEKTFTTTASAPTIEGTAATQVKTESANLRAAIDTEGEATSYHFNWGLTTGYGNTTTTGNLPASAHTAAGLGEVTGLAPGQTYHYQVVATNGTDTTIGPDQSFTTPAQEPGLPGERGYEIVSQYPTGGVPVIPTGPQPHISPDGNHVNFGSYNPLPNTPTGLADQFGQGEWMYESSRGEGSWNIVGTQLSTEFFEAGISGDAQHIVRNTSVGVDPDDQNETGDLYVRQPNGEFVWISRDPRIPVGTPQTEGGLIEYGSGALNSYPNGDTLTPDGSTVVFTSRRHLSELDTGSGCVEIYKWEEGEVTFLGMRPDGTVPQYNTGTCSSMPPTAQDALSADGHRVVWAARRTDDAGGTLYVSTDGEPTVEAVKETGVPPLENPPTGQKPPYNVTFRGSAVEDGSRVFFTSASRLTTDSSAADENVGDADLYAFSVGDDKVRDLTPRTDGLSDPVINPAYRGRARGLVWNSEDGSRFYFVSDARYPTAPSPTGELPSAEGRNLYMGELDGIDDPIRLRFIAALGAGDGANWKSNYGEKTAYGSPDGSYLAFASEENLTEQPLGETSQMFVYDAVSGTLECASCPTDGSLPANNVDEFLQENGEEAGWRWQFGNGGSHWVSTDGTVFFDTASALLPADQNAVEDVYEFRNGQPRLVSAGTGSNPSRIENASINGADVLFTTVDALAVRDKEPGQPKLYDARVGGGFAKVLELPSCDINAGACEGAGTSAPEQVGAGSRAFEGPGNNDESAQVRCKILALESHELRARARKLRGAARRAAKAGKRGRARKLRRRAGRLGRRAHKQSAKAKACRRSAGASRAANTNRRAQR
jgi:WD40-like Beta Propeller Repeat